MRRSYCACLSHPTRHAGHSASSAAEVVREVAVDAHSVAVLARRDPDVAAARALSIAADAEDAVEGPAALVDGDGDGATAEVVCAEEYLVAVDVVSAVQPGERRDLVALVCVTEACGGALDVGDGDGSTAAENVY